MGAGLKMLSACTVLCLLVGCTQTVAIPYVQIAEGVYACGDVVWDQGTLRSRTPTDIQSMQYVPDDSGISLTPGELADYIGTLYSLSNYRELLLQEGFSVEKETRTCDILDTTLFRDDERVRLIYQPSGRIRILFENRQGAAHILLEGMK